jgi:hypothetical protein
MRPVLPRINCGRTYLFERFFYFLNSQHGDPMGYLVFDEIEKSASQVLLNQVGEYFIRTSNGRTRSRLIIPEPFFVHSDLTTMVQMADLVAYIISWGVRLKGMREPKRKELDSLSYKVVQLRFRQETLSGMTHYGFKVIPDLRAAAEQA